MAHIREVRPHAFEIKFVVAADMAERIRVWARTHLEPDPHGSGPFGDEYHTTSIYLDTDDGDVFHRRGSFARSKYRIRRYNNDDVAFLERKMRQPKVLAKRRTLSALASLPQLASPHVDAAWAGSWFHRRLIARRLQPVCQFGYFRMARAMPRDGETVRLTLDSHLSVQSTSVLAFQPHDVVPVLTDRAILELKYRGSAPAMFRRLVEDLGISPQVASKYRMGVTALRALDARIVPLAAGGAEASYA